MALSLRPSHRNPEELQPEVCELCGTRVGNERLIEADVEGLRGFKICGTHGFERRARVTPSYNDYKRMNPPLPVPDVARQEPIGGEAWSDGGVYQARFDGSASSGSVALPSPAGALSIAGRLTLSSAVGTQRNLFGWRNGAASGNRLVDLGRVGINRIGWNLRNDDGTQFVCDSTEAVEVNEEVFVVASLSTADLRMRLRIMSTRLGSILYETAVTGTFATSLPTFVIGRLPDSPSLFFPGNLGYISVFAEELTPVDAEIFRLRSPLAGEAGATAHFPLTEGLGTSGLDTLGGSAMTLSNVTWVEAP